MRFNTRQPKSLFPRCVAALAYAAELVFVAAVLVFVAAACSPLVEEPTAPPDRALPEAAEQRLRGDVAYLAATERKGRGIGTEGIAEAERHIIDRFEQLGLEPPPGFASLVQSLTVYRHGFDAERTKLLISSRDASEAHLPVTASTRTRIARPGDGLRVLPFSATGQAAGPAAFAGYAVDAPERDWDDFGAVDLKGKVALALRYEPWLQRGPVSVYGRMRLTEHAYINTKAAAVSEAGAEALLVVTGPKHANKPEDLRPHELVTLEPDPSPFSRMRIVSDIPVIQISHKLGAQLLEGTDYDLETLQSGPAAQEAPHEVNLGHMWVELQLERSSQPEPLEVRNIAAFLPGKRNDKVIVVGAHHDHLGSFGETPAAVYHGADDNASGVAVVLELAKQLSTRDQPPPVGVVFVTFTAEEVGLLGSRAFVSSSEFQALAPSLMINLDMIGRNPDEPVRVYSSTDDRETGELLTDLAHTAELRIDHRAGQVPPNSDHYPFYRADTPILFLSTGMHEDYHHVSDTAERLDYERMSSIAGFLAALITHACPRGSAP